VIGSYSGGTVCDVVGKDCYATTSAVIGSYSGGTVCDVVSKDCYVFILIMETAHLKID
jgi:hypothetical protein